MSIISSWVLVMKMNGSNPVRISYQNPWESGHDRIGAGDCRRGIGGQAGRRVHVRHQAKIRSDKCTATSGTARSFCWATSTSTGAMRVATTT